MQQLIKKAATHLLVACMTVTAAVSAHANPTDAARNRLETDATGQLLSNLVLLKSITHSNDVRVTQKYENLAGSVVLSAASAGMFGTSVASGLSSQAFDDGMEGMSSIAFSLAISAVPASLDLGYQAAEKLTAQLFRTKANSLATTRAEAAAKIFALDHRSKFTLKNEILKGLMSSNSANILEIMARNGMIFNEEKTAAKEVFQMLSRFDKNQQGSANLSEVLANLEQTNKVLAALPVSSRGKFASRINHAVDQSNMILKRANLILQ